MAVINDAMRWYSSGEGSSAPRLKHRFEVKFYSPYYQTVIGDDTKLLFECVRTVELPKYALETELLNSWNLRTPIPTRVMFEPISIMFNDTVDNKFQNFIAKYMSMVSGNFTTTEAGVRTGFDVKGLTALPTGADRIINKIEIIKFHGQTRNITTLWRPIIVDVQHDTLDYASSDAVTWTISLRYDSVTYDGDEEVTKE
jgi:hypothetical protein